MSEHITVWTKTWARPRFTVYEPADKRVRVMLNRYGAVNGHGGVVIGVGVIVFRRAWSLTWANPHGKPEPVS